MAVYTNATTHLINTPSGIAMIPGVATEVVDEDASNERFQEMVTAGEIHSGETVDPPPENPETTRGGQAQPQTKATITPAQTGPTISNKAQ